MTTFLTDLDLSKILDRSCKDPHVYQNICMDSRKVHKGSLFIALGNGYSFINDAIQNGAIGIITETQYPESFGVSIYQVPSSLEALKKIATFQRDRSHAHIIGITGSCGKTTTKELMNHVFSHQDHRVVASPASYNNHIGVPFSVAQLQLTTTVGIFEMGVNHPGEMAPLSDIVKPTMSLITNIAPAHIGHFQSIQDISKEKIHIIDGMSPKGSLILNRDDECFSLLWNTAHQKGIQHIYTVGYHHESSVRLLSYDDGHISLDIFGRHVDIVMEFAIGQHFAYLSAFVLLIGLLCGYSIDNMLPFMITFKPVDGRGREHNVKHNGSIIHLVDEAYNANPLSMHNALVNFKMSRKSRGRRIVVLGDMRELGDHADAAHHTMIKQAQDLEFDAIFYVGSYWKEFKDQVLSFEKIENLQAALFNYIQDGDKIMMKASRGSGLYKLVEKIIQ
jgi:UDP-N-acetylmuramoyl-tripeptide--D-alanyl-D-alanine ligase